MKKLLFLIVSLLFLIALSIAGYLSFTEEAEGGSVAFGEACIVDEDCLDDALCLSIGAQSICSPKCEGLSCPEGLECIMTDINVQGEALKEQKYCVPVEIAEGLSES